MEVSPPPSPPPRLPPSFSMEASPPPSPSSRLRYFSSLESSSDQRIFSKLFTYRWAKGNCLVTFNSDSNNNVTNPGHRRCYAIDFSLHTKCFDIRLPGSLAGEHDADPVHDYWIEPLSTSTTAADAVGAVESTTAWSELSSHLDLCPVIPSHGSQFLKQKLLALVQDTVKKAIFLEHSTILISLQIDVKTELMLDDNGDAKREMHSMRWGDLEEEEDDDDDDDDENWTTVSNKAMQQHSKVGQLGDGDHQVKEGMCAACLQEIGEGSAAATGRLTGGRHVSSALCAGPKCQQKEKKEKKEKEKEMMIN